MGDLLSAAQTKVIASLILHRDIFSHWLVLSCMNSQKGFYLALRSVQLVKVNAQYLSLSVISIRPISFQE